MHIASCQPPNWRRIDSRRFGTAHIVYLLVLYMFVIAVMPARAKPIQTAVGDAMTRGMNAFRRGDMEQAAILWQQAARDYAAAHQLQAQSVALTHLARAYTALGHSDRARQSLYTALHSAKAAGDVRQTALVFANLGQLAIARQDFEDAEAQLHSALTQASDLRDGQLMATILHHQGNLFWRQRRPRDALTAYRESASMAEQKAQFGMAARALAHAARVAAQAQQPDTAATWLDDARRYLKREAASHETVYDLLLIGRLYQQLATANRELMPKAFSAFQDAQILAHDLQDQRALAYAWGYLGHLYEVEHRYADALVLTRRAVLAAQQTSTPESLYQWEWQTAGYCERLGVTPRRWPRTHAPWRRCSPFNRCYAKDTAAPMHHFATSLDHSISNMSICFCKKRRPSKRLRCGWFIRRMNIIFSRRRWPLSNLKRRNCETILAMRAWMPPGLGQHRSIGSPETQVLSIRFYLKTAPSF